MKQRGLTLTELMIVMAIAGLVTVGLVGFYLNSQGTWLDGSTQALTQREATIMVDEISRRIRVSNDALIQAIPDSAHHSLSLYDVAGNEYRYAWDSGDSLVHGISTPNGGPAFDEGPTLTSKVRRLQFDRDSAVVYIRAVELVTPNGQIVLTRSAAVLYNRGTP